ncbi:hypothetical protein ACIQCR_35145 [Streptomyces sp. NPDC093249]|uniref:hypothetical protein n=1 Tax=unclassified Streptomyces TaxID=2593676 RepID=UPI00382BD5B3
MPNETAEQLGGLDLIRAALLKAARELDWKSGTYGFGGGQGSMALIGIHDKREIPEPYAQVMGEHRQRQMRAAVDRVATRYVL